MKLCNISRGSHSAYRCAAKIIAEQIAFELETCRQLLGTEPAKVLELMANTPDWTTFLEDEDTKSGTAPATSDSHMTQLEHHPKENDNNYTIK